MVFARLRSWLTGDDDNKPRGGATLTDPRRSNSLNDISPATFSRILSPSTSNRFERPPPAPTPTPTFATSQQRMGGYKPRVPTVYTGPKFDFKPAASSPAREPEQPEAETAPQMSRANRQVLEALGWTLPEREPVEKSNALSMLDMSNAKDLTEFSYQVDEDEMHRMAQTYEQYQGFKAPRRMDKLEGDDDERLKVTGRTVKSAPMKQEAFDALNDDQKAAVNFNTLFLKAREKDLAGGHMPSKEDKEEYKEKYVNIFGQDPKGGEEYFAPHVVDVLTKINFTAQGHDLDEFMALEHLVQMDELDSFSTENLNLEELVEGPTVMADYGGNNYATARGAENLQVIDAQLVDDAGAAILDALENNPDAWDFSSALSYEFFGTPPDDTMVPWGFGRDEMRESGADPGKDDFFRKQYQGLRQLGNVDLMWQDIEQSGMTEEDQQQLFQFMDLKTKRDIQMGLIDPGDEEAMGAQDIRVLLGLDEEV